MTERRLTFIRHAKSSWKDPLLTDIERPLTRRGREDAKQMAPLLVEHGATFNTIMASPARRARETIARMLITLPAQDVQLAFDQDYYTFDASALLEAIRKLDDKLEDVTIIGHNPALQDALQWLTGEAITEFPTCAAAHIALTLPRWSKLKQGNGELMWLLAPEKGNSSS